VRNRSQSLRVRWFLASCAFVVIMTYVASHQRRPVPAVLPPVAATAPEPVPQPQLAAPPESVPEPQLAAAPQSAPEPQLAAAPQSAPEPQLAAAPQSAPDLRPNGVEATAPPQQADPVRLEEQAPAETRLAPEPQESVRANLIAPSPTTQELVAPTSSAEIVPIPLPRPRPPMQAAGRAPRAAAFRAPQRVNSRAIDARAR